MPPFPRGAQATASRDMGAGPVSKGVVIQHGGALTWGLGGAKAHAQGLRAKLAARDLSSLPSGDALGGGERNPHKVQEHTVPTGLPEWGLSTAVLMPGRARGCLGALREGATGNHDFRKPLFPSG